MLEDLVRKVSEELRLRDRAMDGAMGNARKARVLSKQAILQLHGGAVGEAEKRLDEARELLVEMDRIIDRHPEIGHYEQVAAAREEYAEATILHGLNTGGGFPDPEEVSVPLQSYVMGLGDVPGELRRQALDGLRVGDMDLAVSRLETMQSIYINLVSMEEAPLLKGMRRKLDIARGVIERTRSEITAEAGRRRLDESVKRLADKLDE
jgi:translin